MPMKAVDDFIAEMCQDPEFKKRFDEGVAELEREVAAMKTRENNK
ncbi:hypothetical protein [Levilactobacillus koreensis]|nr:hypothetical protein [Levilactobacillus koreensis]